jgi:signal transduction histidine kinase
MISLLIVLTAVVCIITFTMANFFHDDKHAYMKDWISIAALSTAEECRSLLVGYTERLEISSLIMLDDEMKGEERDKLLQSVFEHFPQLVEVAIYYEGEELEVATDLETLEAAGLTREDLRAYQEQHPLPLEHIEEGALHLRNATISPELPTFSLAFASSAEPEETPLVISALIRLDELLRLGANFKVFEVLMAAEDGTLLVHPDPRKIAQHAPADLRPEASKVHEEFRAGMTLEYTQEGTEMLGGFASVDFGGVTVAAQVPKAAAFLASRDLLGRLMAVGLFLLILGAVGGRFWARRITRPVERLSDATREIAKGQFDIRVDVESRDEIGALAGSFNQMASGLLTRDKELEEAHAQLIQSEKLAAFGQLGAGIAHEVKNPLAGILGCAQLALMTVEEGTPLHKNVTLIEKETERCKTIIENLLKFARQDKAILEPTEINTVVEDSAAIVNHQLELNQVKLVRQLGQDLPVVRANANQLQQVLMNLMMNAQQAMEGAPGTVTVATREAEEGHVEVIVSDTGPGIPKEIQAKLFEPFFTTKPTGKGTGLGLSVSFGII